MTEVIGKKVFSLALPAIRGKAHGRKFLEIKRKAFVADKENLIVRARRGVKDDDLSQEALDHLKIL